MKIYQISYNADPDVPFETCLDHLGDPIELTEERVRTFDRIDNALEFLLECSYPITDLSELRHSFAREYGERIPFREEIKVFEVY